jgi:hypothetical protein
LGAIHTFCILPAFDAEDYNATCGIAESGQRFRDRPAAIFGELAVGRKHCTVFVASGALEIELKAFLSFRDESPSPAQILFLS